MSEIIFFTKKKSVRRSGSGSVSLEVLKDRNKPVCPLVYIPEPPTSPSWNSPYDRTYHWIWGEEVANLVGVTRGGREWSVLKATIAMNQTPVKIQSSRIHTNTVSANFCGHPLKPSLLHSNFYKHVQYMILLPRSGVGGAWADPDHLSKSIHFVASPFSPDTVFANFNGCRMKRFEFEQPVNPLLVLHPPQAWSPPLVIQFSSVAADLDERSITS